MLYLFNITFLRKSNQSWYEQVLVNTSIYVICALYENHTMFGKNVQVTLATACSQLCVSLVCLTAIYISVLNVNISKCGQKVCMRVCVSVNIY